eukprot:TRINITY_DN12072_c0_g1_i1.p1 TRINITY_DN12072_c0_g1~~TRINITY_DN12072_c0_g1_i1.p1  ORF type:complete len:439 (-),score=87.97 TRINITY_DN12072_c0_g1_i1:12-1328(-)
MTKHLKKQISQMSDSHPDMALRLFLQRVANANSQICTQHSRHGHELYKQVNQVVGSFNNELEKTKDVMEDYLVTRDEFLNASSKVRSLNTNKKVVLSKLEKLEESRDECGTRFDKLDELCRDAMKQLTEKIKGYIMDEVTFYVEERLKYHRAIVEILEKLVLEIDEQRSLVHKLREERAKQEVQIQPKTTWDMSAPTLGADLTLIQSLCNKIEFPISFTSFSIKDKSPILHTFNLTQRTLEMSTGSKYSISDIDAALKVPYKHDQIWMKLKEFECRFSFESPQDREKWMECFWLMKYRCDSPLDIHTGSIPLSEQIKILVATWNMGDAPPKYTEDPIESWLPSGYDLYVITTQECNYTPRPGYSNCQSDFYQWVGDHLGGDYLKLATTHLMSIRIGVFIKRKHYYKISNLRCASVPTGIANMISDEGNGVSSSLFNHD